MLGLPIQLGWGCILPDGRGSRFPAGSRPAAVIVGLLLYAGLLSPAQAEEFSVGGEWLCNLGKVRRDTPGNKTIKIEQSGNKLAFVNERGRRSSGQLVNRDVLLATNWEYGEKARLGISVDGTFFSVTDASMRFGVPAGRDWNFILWASGTICLKSKDSPVTAQQPTARPPTMPDPPPPIKKSATAKKVPSSIEEHQATGKAPTDPRQQVRVVVAYFEDALRREKFPEIIRVRWADRSLEIEWLDWWDYHEGALSIDNLLSRSRAQ